MRPLGISRDSPWTHIAWAQVLDLDFPLLSDWNGEATDGFDIGRDYRGFHGIPARSAFIADAGGIVRDARRYDDDQVPDVEDLVSAARALPGA